MVLFCLEYDFFFYRSAEKVAAEGPDVAKDTLVCLEVAEPGMPFEDVPNVTCAQIPSSDFFRGFSKDDLVGFLDCMEQSVVGAKLELLNI